MSRVHSCPACLKLYDPFEADWRVTHHEPVMACGVERRSGFIEHVHDGIRYMCDEVEVVDKAAHDGLLGAYEQAKAERDARDVVHLSHSPAGNWFVVQPSGANDVAAEVKSLVAAGRTVLRLDGMHVDVVADPPVRPDAGYAWINPRKR